MDKIAIIMCTWQRTDKLKHTLNMLKNQTYKNFDLYIWNNNIKKAHEVEKATKEFKAFNVTVHNSRNNVGGVGRFLYAKKLHPKYPYVLFIDDDQQLGASFVEEMNSYKQKKTVVSWWGWKIKDSYFSRTRVQNLGAVDYCGTGGMILDSSLFKHANVYNIPQKFAFVEDLWLSYVAKYEHKFKLKGCNASIKIIVDGKDQYTKLKTLKQDLYIYFKNKYKF